MIFQEIKKWRLFEKKKLVFHVYLLNYETFFSIGLRQKMRIIQNNRLMYSLIGFEYCVVLQIRYLFVFSQKLVFIHLLEAI